MTPPPAPSQSNRAAQSADTLFDELLVMLAREGDKRAFDRLHARWHLRLARAALRYTGDADTARDLSQECWLAVWKGLARLEHPSRFRAYLFGVLHRRGADHVRQRMQARKRETDVAGPPRSGEKFEPAEPALQGERSAIREAFAALPPNQRLAAHLHFVEGLTLDEIAAAQSIPSGTVKSRLFHARRKLKAALRENPEGDDR